MELAHLPVTDICIERVTSWGNLSVEPAAVRSYRSATTRQQEEKMDFGAAMFFTDYSMTPAELGQVLEARGFESIWAPEHSHIPSTRKTPPASGGELEKRYYDVMDPFVTLTAGGFAVLRRTCGARFRGCLGGLFCLGAVLRAAKVAGLSPAGPILSRNKEVGNGSRHKRQQDTRTAASPDRGPLRDLQSHRQPSAQRGYRCWRLHGFGVDRRRRVRPWRRIRPADRTGGDRRRVLEPRAPPGDRAGDRAFCRLALCADHRRHGVRNILSADPRAGPCPSAVRCPQSWLVARLPRASCFGLSLGDRAHRRGLENQAPHFAPAGRHRAGSRDLGRCAGALKRLT